MHLLSPYTENIRKCYNFSLQNIQMPLTLFILFHILTLAYFGTWMLLNGANSILHYSFPEKERQNKIKYPKLLFLTIGSLKKDN